MKTSKVNVDELSLAIIAREPYTKTFNYSFVREDFLNVVVLVREAGLEPARRKTLDPKSSASANFATRAN